MVEMIGRNVNFSENLERDISSKNIIFLFFTNVANTILKCIGPSTLSHAQAHIKTYINKSFYLTRS